MVPATVMGVFIGVGTFTFVYAKGYSYLTNDPSACCQLSHHAFWEVDAFTNRAAARRGRVLHSVQLGIHHIPVAQAVFDIGPVSAADCALTLLVALGPVTVIEVAKLGRRWSTAARLS